MRQLLVFFYQIVPLVSVGLEDPASSQSGVINVLIAGFNLDLQGNGAGLGEGVCLFRGMTSVLKLVVGSSVPLLMISWSMAIRGMVSVLYHSRHTNAHMQLPRPESNNETETPRRKIHWRQGGNQAVLVSLTLGYSTLLKNTFTLLHCVEVEGLGLRLLVSGNVECYNSWQHALAVIVTILAMFPLGLVLWLRHQMNCPSFVGSAAESYLNAFTRKRWYWPAGIFAERLFLVVVFTFTPEVHRPYYLFFTLLILVPLHLACKPFREPMMNVIDAFVLGTLAALASLSTTGTLYLRVSVSDQDKFPLLTTFGFLLQLLPMLMFFGCLLSTMTSSQLKRLSISKRREERHTPQNPACEWISEAPWPQSPVVNEFKPSLDDDSDVDPDGVLWC
mmetsp:Transcript_60614/g.131550  ORF Transcript_60614/g.131550 Transcript_60614/m.131550 type:complete len:390 (-) Transcript_60614:191-1360(-)